MSEREGKEEKCRMVVKERKRERERGRENCSHTPKILHCKSLALRSALQRNEHLFFCIIHAYIHDLFTPIFPRLLRFFNFIIYRKILSQNERKWKSLKSFVRGKAVLLWLQAKNDSTLMSAFLSFYVFMTRTNYFHTDGFWWLKLHSVQEHLKSLLGGRELMTSFHYNYRIKLLWCEDNRKPSNHKSSEWSFMTLSLRKSFQESFSLTTVSFVKRNLTRLVCMFLWKLKKIGLKLLETSWETSFLLRFLSFLQNKQKKREETQKLGNYFCIMPKWNQ